MKFFGGINGCADTNCRFVCAGIGSYGKDCVSIIFKRSTLWASIQKIMLELTSKISLPGTEGPNVPHFFLGDEGFSPQKYTSTFWWI